MKKILILFLLISSMNLLLSEQTNKNKTSYHLDFDKINVQYHSKQFEKNENYLEALNVAELFEFAYELAIFDSAHSESNWMIIFSPLKKKMKEDDYSDLYIECLKYDFNNSGFRFFLLEIASKEITKGNTNFNKYQDTLLEIALNRNIKTGIRKYAISDLGSKDEKYQEALSDLFVELNDDRLIGAVITKMRRNKHPKLQEYILPILTNHQDYNKEILHPAISSSDERNISILGKIARETTDPLTYRICLGFFGILNTPKAVIECINSLGRFSNDDSVKRKASLGRYLWKSQVAVELMLQDTSSIENKFYALKAIRIAKMPFGDELKKRIEIIRTASSNIELKKECQLTLDFLNEYKNKEEFDKDHKFFIMKYRE